MNMKTTRRGAMGLMAGAAAAAGAVSMVGGARPAHAATAAAGTANATDPPRNLGSADKAMMWIASVTPCDKNLKFDPGAFRDILAWFKHNGADGILVFGSTGEFPSFSLAERKLVIETALRDKMGMNFLVGPGTSNYLDTIDLAKHAQDHGADGLLVIPPFYFKHIPPEGLFEYYDKIFNAVSIPINLYHYPSMSAIPITRQLLKRLHQYPQLAGIKDSEGNEAEYQGFITEFADLNMRTGTSSKLEQALTHGMGAILEDANVFCKACQNVFTTYRAGGDWRAALAQMRATEAVLREGTASAGGMYGFGQLKYALSVEMGGPQTYARPPYPVEVSDAQKKAIRSTIDRMSGMPNFPVRGRG
ncbi:MAG: dihydrodipicolinate synthase family protein [Steroidobacteraceae bacterium]